ncbi:hypothetical protein QTG56_25880 (plasmid) [Rossellomorea sp. AcN35-11]|nr:hypothetical protein [Rossellomorea aquimaris]WJV32047.1 hypothetical protein QTG56_25880 [Rossellomorea sp. AcN35-11]
MDEVLELAKKELIKQMKEEFPKFRYRLADGEAMNLSEAGTGQLVKYKEKDEFAIITAVKPTTKHPIHVRSESGSFKAVSNVFELVKDEKEVEEVLNKKLFKKQYDFMWTEGDVGYFLNKGEASPVVIGGTTRGKTRVFNFGIKTDGRYYSLDEQSMKRIFETKEEAESHL